MPHRPVSPRLSKAVLAFCLLTSAASLSACGGQAPPVVTSPPRTDRPCDVPFAERAQELPAQPDLDRALDAAGWTALQGQDYAAHNSLIARFNGNLDWTREKCIARPVPAPEP
jgi:hypothetical protein